MTRRKPTQPALPGTSERYRPGTIERNAAADITALATVLPAGTTALQSAYKTLARELDRAEKERDRYGKIYAAREMLKIRQSLTPMTGDDAEDAPQTVDEFIAGLPAAPVGDAPKP